MIAVLIRAGTALAGLFGVEPTPLVVRFVPVLAGAVASLAAVGIARRIAGDARRSLAAPSCSRSCRSPPRGSCSPRPMRRCSRSRRSRLYCVVRALQSPVRSQRVARAGGRRRGCASGSRSRRSTRRSCFRSRVVVAVLVRPSLRARLREPGPVRRLRARDARLPARASTGTRRTTGSRSASSSSTGSEASEGLGAQARARPRRRTARARVTDSIRAGGRRRLARAAPAARRRAVRARGGRDGELGASSSTARCAVRSRRTGRRRRTSPASPSLAAGDGDLRGARPLAARRGRARGRARRRALRARRSCRSFRFPRGATRSRAAAGWDELAQRTSTRRAGRSASAQLGRRGPVSGRERARVPSARPARGGVRLPQRPSQSVRAVARLRRRARHAATHSSSRSTSAPRRARDRCAARAPFRAA